MFVQLLFLASLSKLCAIPIDPTIPHDADNCLHTRDTSTGAGDNLRTTYGIVWSCAVTILACVWGAVHPNIPGPFDGKWTTLKRRITMTSCALIAPELMVMWALRQHIAAKEIVKLYNERIVLQEIPVLDQSARQGIVCEWLGSAKKAIYALFADLPHDITVRRKPRLVRSFNPVSDREPWTMTHGFFAQMGGFMLYEDEKPKEVLDFGQMCFWIQIGQIAAPTVTEAELKDRSKGNALSKCVIVLQTSWFVVQCLARLASRLSLSELEVVTLAFAVMNGIVYWVWWDKPQGVDMAIPIHLQFPGRHGSESKDATVGTADYDAEIPATSGLNSEELSETRSTSYQEVSGTDAQVNKAIHILSDTMEDARAQDISSSESETLTSNSFKTYRGMTESQPLVYPEGKTESSTGSILSTKTHAINLWNTLKTAVSYPFVQLRDMILDEGISNGDMHVPIFYAADLDVHNHLMSATCVIGALFGAVHFFAWASVFPSPAERIVWRVSVLITTAGPLLFSLLLFISDRWLGDNSDLFTGLLMIVISVPYVIGRIALLTVALLSLRALQHDVFIQISWTSFIPHF